MAAEEEEEMVQRAVEIWHLQRVWREKYDIAAEVTPWQRALFQNDSFKCYSNGKAIIRSDLRPLWSL